MSLGGVACANPLPPLSAGGSGWADVLEGVADASPSDRALSLAVIGDYGAAGGGVAAVAKLVASWRTDIVVTVGDNNYPEGAAALMDVNIGQYYHSYIKFNPTYRGLYQELGAAEQRFFPCPGNHDWQTGTLQPYLDYFDLPGEKRYYQVRRGPVAIFSLDSDAYEPDGNESDSRQARWLQAALAASDAPWKLVTLHHPPYSRGDHGSSENLRWPFAAWGASLVLAGHDHHYERLEVDGLTYIVTGAGGARLKPVLRPSLPEAAVDVVVDLAFGALRLDATATGLEGRYYDVEGKMRDAFRLAGALPARGEPFPPQAP